MSRSRISFASSPLSCVLAALLASACGNHSAAPPEQAKQAAASSTQRLTSEVPADRSPEDVAAALRASEKATNLAAVQGTYTNVSGTFVYVPAVHERAVSLIPLAELTKGQARVEFDQDVDLEGPTPGDNAQESARFITSRSSSIKQFDSLPKQQSERGWCTAFAMVGALENLTRQRDKHPNLSEVHHWSHYREYQTWESAKAGVAHWITEEKTWPYRAHAPADVESKGIARATGVEILKTPTQVYSTLDDKLPALLSTQVTREWFNSDGFISANSEAIGGHALLVVAYNFSEKSPGGGYFTIKNSWGRKWGDHGYGYLPFSYCSRFYCSFIKVNGLELRKSTEPGSDPRPAPKPSPRPQPNPSSKVTESDFLQMFRYSGEKNGVKIYSVSLKARPEILQRVRSVHYDLNKYASVPAQITVEASDETRASGFATGKMEMLAGGWRAEGTVVTLTTGETIKLRGMLARW